MPYLDLASMTSELYVPAEGSAARKVDREYSVWSEILRKNWRAIYQEVLEHESRTDHYCQQIDDDLVNWDRRWSHLQLFYFGFTPLSKQFPKTSLV